MIARLRNALTAVVVSLAACAAYGQASEAAVKAAFLYKFPAYIEWPAGAFASAESPFVIGVVGSDEVATELERLAPGRAIASRRIVVRRIREGEPVRGMHMVFIGRLDAAGRAIGRTVQPGTLVVTDGERGLEAGGAISFVAFEDRVAFEVSLENAERAGLRISSRMLAVALRVVPRG